MDTLQWSMDRYGVERLRIESITDTCTIPDCTNRVRVLSRGWCAKHYQRWQKTGDPLKCHHEYRTENVGYGGVHTRMRLQRGLASDHMCSCGKRAMDWAYVGGCEAEKVGRSGKYTLAYCVHITEHYEPMCRKCHKNHDVNQKKVTP